MPELPEVETVVRSLSSRLIGLEVDKTKLFHSPVLRNGDESGLRRLHNRKVIRVYRRGKMILIDYEKNITLLCHMMMTGQFLFYRLGERMNKHTRFTIAFKKYPYELRFQDVRKFGFISLHQTSDLHSADELDKLGPEPLDLDFSLYAERFKHRKTRMKSLFLDQSFLAGIGNIYADEILFKAKIHPLTSASSLREEEVKLLWEAMRKVLKKAIRHRGSSVRNYRDTKGEPGDFQNHHKVYGRESDPCPSCGEKIRRIKVNGRSSHFCPRCQSL